MSHLSYTHNLEKVFTNWKEEIDICLRIMRGEASPRIITVIDTLDGIFSDTARGPGGTGKSLFLKRLFHIMPDGNRLENGKLIYAIRFDWLVENYDEIAIMNAIMNRLVEDNPNTIDYFTSFNNTNTGFQKRNFPDIPEKPNGVMGGDEFIVENISNIESSSINVADYIIYFTQEARIKLTIDELILLRRVFFQCLFNFLNAHPEITLVLYFDAVEKAANIYGWFDCLYEHGFSNKIPLNLTVFVASRTRPCTYLNVPTEKFLVIEAGYLDFHTRKEYLGKLEKNYGKVKLPNRILLLSKKSTYQEFFLFFRKSNPKKVNNSG